jgi:gamma-glutamylcyclotransferase (GGCT)/AIG2-like uncharacterized protein YtfP
MTDGRFHLFVYGTLQSGGSARDLLANCDLIGAASVGGVLYDIDGEFPALVLYGATPVRGEVWQCPAELLKTLDAYEGTASGLFRRVGVHAQVGGEEIGCWAYVAGPRLSRKLTPARRVTTWQKGRHGS